MANTWSFFPTAATLIKAAMRRIRAYDPEDATTISAVQYANALETLNFIMSGWQALGMQIWCRKTGSKSLTANQGIYTVGAAGADILINRPMDIMQAWMTDTTSTPNVDIPVGIIGQQEYLSLSSKLSTGTPTQLFYDPEYDGASNKGANAKGKLYLWPYPDANAAAFKTLKFLYQRPLEDFDATSDDIDMPQEWFNALRLQLALSIAPEYGMPVMEYDRLKGEAEEWFELAKSWDTEQDSLFLMPDYTTYGI